MYDWPEIRQATDAWWAGIARHAGVSVKLTRGDDYSATWRQPDLLFSQICGYSVANEYRGRLKLIATPHYAVDGCIGPHYSSIVFARSTQPLSAFRGACAAYNNPDSMSGRLALQLVFAPLAQSGEFFARAIETGGHVSSMQAVREGRADVCAIDAVCVALAKRYRPDCLEGLVEIARSPHVPGLPYVTRSGNPLELLAALEAAFADPDLQQTRDSLFLDSLSVLTASDYDRISDLEGWMEEGGGLRLID
jgi:ABC-type phosphate/phosphonate transport system substrate-binding protein